MVVVAPLLVRGFVSPLQSLAALAMIITGIFDRVKRVFYPSYIRMPVWTGGLILVTAAVGVVVGNKINTASSPTLVVTYRALNIFCCILCGLIALWYGTAVGMGLATDSYDQDKNTAVVGIIFVLAVIEIFLSILGALASQERNSSYLQLVDPPMEPPSGRQTGTPIPLIQVQGSNLSTCGPIQGGIQTQAGAAYQIMPQAVLQAGTPVMMAPGYINQMATSASPVMLVPTQNMQQLSRTTGTGQMYVQVPANLVLSNNTQVSAPSQVPQETTSPSEELQGAV